MRGPLGDENGASVGGTLGPPKRKPTPTPSAKPEQVAPGILRGPDGRLRTDLPISHAPVIVRPAPSPDGEAACLPPEDAWGHW